MGLFDEAISEFRQAADDPAHRIACLILQGTCFLEKGNPEAAENVLRSLLKPELGMEDACSIKYELALICEASGKSAEAAGLLAEIDADYPGFRDVRTRLDSSGDALTLDFSDEELKGFDLK
jgi:predicted Zn-dependent protease